MAGPPEPEGLCLQSSEAVSQPWSSNQAAGVRVSAQVPQRARRLSPTRSLRASNRYGEELPRGQV